jgi:undecaprenyl-diphosphatase
VSDRTRFFGPVVAVLDEQVDAALDRIRGNPLADRVFFTASALGDWSLIWHLVGATEALADERRLPDMLRLSATLGVESLAVNQGVKRFFHRQRPEFGPGPPPAGLRIPTTSSFPSGHASAAFCAAVLLSQRRPASAPVWFGLATVIALSRCYVRMHHASDIIVGGAIGAALGVVAIRLVPLGR